MLNNNSKFRSEVMKLAWPVRHVAPQLAYGVSLLSSKINQAAMLDWRRLYTLQKEAKELVRNGQARIVFRKLSLDKAVVVTSLDASFAKEPGLKSQSGFVSMITEESIYTRPTLCNVVEYGSSRISRVVKSTMAAESTSLTLALDRQLKACYMVNQRWDLNGDIR